MTGRHIGRPIVVGWIDWLIDWYGIEIMTVQKCVWVPRRKWWQSCWGETELSSLLIQTTCLTERPATTCTCTTAVYTCHTALRVPFPRLLAIPGRRESYRESSGKLRPPVQHTISLQPHCAWRKSARGTRMCRYLEQLFYRSTIYLTVLDSVRPCVRPTKRPATPSTCLSIRP